MTLLFSLSVDRLGNRSTGMLTQVMGVSSDLLAQEEDKASLPDT